MRDPPRHETCWLLQSAEHSRARLLARLPSSSSTQISRPSCTANPLPPPLAQRLSKRPTQKRSPSPSIRPRKGRTSPEGQPAPWWRDWPASHLATSFARLCGRATVATGVCHEEMMDTAEHRYLQCHVTINKKYSRSIRSRVDPIGGTVERYSEKDTKLTEKLAQLQRFIAVFPHVFMGRLVYYGPT